MAKKILVPITKLVPRRRLKQFLTMRESQQETLRDTGIVFLKWRGPAQRPADAPSHR